jgi:hypothetical protein
LTNAATQVGEQSGAPSTARVDLSGAARTVAHAAPFIEGHGRGHVAVHVRERRRRRDWSLDSQVRKNRRAFLMH